MKIRILFMLILLGSLSACIPQTSEVSPPIVLEDRSHPQIEVIYGTEEIKNCLYVYDRVLDQSRNLPRCIVHVKNLIQQRIPVEYQFLWEDIHGAPVSTKAAWQRITLPENSEKTLVSIGKSPLAKKVKFYLRFAKDVEIWVPTPDPAELMKAQQSQ